MTIYVSGFDLGNCSTLYKELLEVPGFSEVCERVSAQAALAMYIVTSNPWACSLNDQLPCGPPHLHGVRYLSNISVTHSQDVDGTPLHVLNHRVRRSFDHER